MALIFQDVDKTKKQVEVLLKLKMDENFLQNLKNWRLNLIKSSHHEDKISWNYWIKIC